MSSNKPRKSHAKALPQSIGDLQCDIQHIRGMQLLVCVDRYTKYKVLEHLPSMKNRYLLAALQNVRAKFPTTRIQVDMQFQHLKGDPTLPELLVTPREAHGQQGAIERAIQEVKK